MPFTRRFDMRNIARRTFLDRLHEVDAKARAHFDVGQVDRQYSTEGTDTVVTWVPARGITGSGLAAIEDALADTVKQINGEKLMAGPVTGAKALGDMFRGHLANIKSQLDKAGQDMNAAMGDLRDTTIQATEMVKAVKTETADLKASLGLHSNHPPEDNDGA